jgi:hypothetical protein
MSHRGRSCGIHDGVEKPKGNLWETHGVPTGQYAHPIISTVYGPYHTVRENTLYSVRAEDYLIFI